jgi:hypothetical protein
VNVQRGPIQASSSIVTPSGMKHIAPIRTRSPILTLGPTSQTEPICAVTPICASRLTFEGSQTVTPLVFHRSS